VTAANRHVGRGFYPGSAAAIAVIIFAGFARNYYLRAWIGTRAISFMVHMHGLIMTAWVLLFLTQTLLVSKHRTDLHRKLGVIGAILAAMVVALGVYTIAGSIVRRNPGAETTLFAELFVAFDGVSLLLFGGLVMTALIQRRHTEIHKRLMLFAVLSLLPPALGRLVAYFTHRNIELIVLGLMYSSVLTCVLVDAIRHRRFHPASVYSGALVLVSSQVTCFAQVRTS
jgi:hypothetical protein